MSANRDAEALLDIQKAGQKVLKFKTEMSYEEFCTDEKTQSASYAIAIQTYRGH